jgi:hypothetical protein
MTSTIGIPQPVIQRANKSPWIAGILTLVLPFAGYIYTSRKWLALVVFLVWLPLITGPNDETISTLLGFLMFGTMIENIISIYRARTISAATNSQAQQQKVTQDLRVTLLKLARQKGQITVADCVISTGKAVDEIRSILSELECEDLLRSDNREHDGALVYKVV